MIVTANPAAPERMTSVERLRVRAAAHRAQQIYPGPVGDLLARELHAWNDLGFRFDGTKLVARLCDHLLQTPLPR